MLPDLDGFEVCRRCGSDGGRTPVLFLTARDATEDKVRGLTLGGDDYLVKPFSLEELVARIRPCSAAPAPPDGTVLALRRPRARRRRPPGDRAGVEVVAVADRVQPAALPARQPGPGAEQAADSPVSNNTTPKGEPSFVPAEFSTKEFQGDVYGRVLHFGIREHAMGSIMNGIALHGGTRVYGGTFLVFSDYMRPAVRLASLMQLPVTYVWTHDSIGLGEDGPTHQPVEHLAALRAIPGLDVVRPADANETVAAWQTDPRSHRPPGRPRPDPPERPGLPARHRRVRHAPRASHRGGYVLIDAESGSPDVVLIGTGSEVQLAVEARDQLAAKGISARVVSMPCREWFDAQDQAYRDSVIPPIVKARVSVEAGVAMGWRDVVGDARPHASRSSTSAPRPTTPRSSASSASPPRPSSSPPRTASGPSRRPPARPTTQHDREEHACPNASSSSPTQECRSGSTTCPASGSRPATSPSWSRTSPSSA